MNEEQLYQKFEDDVRDMLGAQMRNSKQLCEEFWSALANVEWYYISQDTLAKPISYSFRGAGGLISSVLAQGCYLDWYCCGDVGIVTDYIARALKKKGWIYDNVPSICSYEKCFNAAGIFSGGRAFCSEHSHKLKEDKEDVSG